MIASLPMYERAETVAAHDIFWAALRDELLRRGVEAPQRLSRDHDPWSHWRSPDLILSQTCGLPFRSELHEIVKLVGTPDYGLANSPPGHYFSVLVCRADDPTEDPANAPEAVMAVNDYRSQSGWAAPLERLEKRPPLIRLTGSHRASARLVAEGAADWAAIDAVSWQGMNGSPEIADQLRIFARTRPTPGLPLITSGQRDPEPIAEAVQTALQELDEQILTGLGIRSLIRIPKEDYFSLPTPPAC